VWVRSHHPSVVSKRFQLGVNVVLAHLLKEGRLEEAFAETPLGRGEHLHVEQIAYRRTIRASLGHARRGLACTGHLAVIVIHVAWVMSKDARG